MLLNLLQEFVGEPLPKGAQSQSVVRGFGAGLRVPVGFTALQNAWGLGAIASAPVANAVAGDGYQPFAQHGQWRAFPFYDNPVFDTAATLWGDNYSPRAQHGQWRAKSYNDNPTYDTAAGLWGDNYSPYAQFRAWAARAILDNPCLAQSLATGVFGDGYQPYAQFKAWNNRTYYDNPVFAAAATRWGDGFTVPARFRGYLVPQSFTCLITGFATGILQDPTPPAIATGQKEKRKWRRTSA